MLLNGTAVPLPPPSLQLSHPPPSFPVPLLSVPPPPLPISVPPPPLPVARPAAPTDQAVLELVDRVMREVMSRGLFDSFRRQCLDDVDTRPAYQNLHLRVVRFVRVFLRQQKWSPDLNRNQLRERMGRQLMVSQFLDSGVARIIDQVINRNVCSDYSARVDRLVREVVADDCRFIVSKESAPVTVGPGGDSRPFPSDVTDGLDTPSVLTNPDVAYEFDPGAALLADHQFGDWCRQFRSSHSDMARTDELPRAASDGLTRDVCASSPSSLSSSPPPPPSASHSASDHHQSAPASLTTLSEDAKPCIADDSTARTVESTRDSSDLEPSGNVDRNSSDEDSDVDSPCVLSQMSPLSEVGADSDLGDFGPDGTSIQTTGDALQVEQSCSASAVGSHFLSECVVDGLATDSCVTVEQLDSECFGTSTVELQRSDPHNAESVDDSTCSSLLDGSADEFDFVGFTSEILTENVAGEDVVVTVESDESDYDVVHSVVCNSAGEQTVDVSGSPVPITDVVSSPVCFAMEGSLSNTERSLQVEKCLSDISECYASISVAASSVQYDAAANVKPAEAAASSTVNCVSLKSTIDSVCIEAEDSSSQLARSTCKHWRASSRDSKRHKSSRSIKYERSSSTNYPLDSRSSHHRSRTSSSSHPSKSSRRDNSRHGRESSRSSSKHRDHRRSSSSADRKRIDSNRSDHRHGSLSQSSQHKHSHRRESSLHRHCSQSADSTDRQDPNGAPRVRADSSQCSDSARINRPTHSTLSFEHRQNSDSVNASAVQKNSEISTKFSLSLTHSDTHQRTFQSGQNHLGQFDHVSLSDTDVSSSRGVKRGRRISGELPSKFSRLSDREQSDIAASEHRLRSARVVLVRCPTSVGTSNEVSEDAVAAVSDTENERRDGVSDFPAGDSGRMADNVDSNDAVHGNDQCDVLHAETDGLGPVLSNINRAIDDNCDNVPVSQQQTCELTIRHPSPTIDSVCSSSPSWRGDMSYDSSEVEGETIDRDNEETGIGGHELDGIEVGICDDETVHALEGSSDDEVDWNGWPMGQVSECVELVYHYQLARAAYDDLDGRSISSVDTDELSEYDELMELDIELHDERERQTLLSMGWTVSPLALITDSAGEGDNEAGGRGSVGVGGGDNEVGGRGSVSTGRGDKEVGGRGSVSAGRGDKEVGGRGSVSAGRGDKEVGGCGSVSAGRGVKEVVGRGSVGAGRGVKEVVGRGSVSAGRGVKEVVGRGSVSAGRGDKEVGGRGSVSAGRGDNEVVGCGSVSAGRGDKEVGGCGSVSAVRGEEEADGRFQWATPTPIRSRRRLSAVNYQMLHSGESDSGLPSTNPLRKSLRAVLHHGSNTARPKSTRHK